MLGFNRRKKTVDTTSSARSLISSSTSGTSGEGSKRSAGGQGGSPLSLAYDEFAFFHENAIEYGLAYSAPPVVVRRSVRVENDDQLSALVWGRATPELVLLHGGAQNAHTFDTVAMALDTSLVALDLPGHGHSDGVRSTSLDIEESAIWVARAICQLAPRAEAVVGMSLGGLVAMKLLEIAPELVRRLILIDITPGVNAEKAKLITAFVNGPATFPDFERLLMRTIEHNPGRSLASLRRGILHNAIQQPDGTWRWRYARHGANAHGFEGLIDHAPLWDVLEASRAPVCLVRGMRPQSVVDDADEAELLARRPDATVVRIAQAGHSVQGDTPVELSRVIAHFALAN